MRNPSRKPTPLSDASRDTLTLELSGTRTAHSGQLLFNKQRSPVTITREGATLEGTFTVEHTHFPFSATLAGDTLTLETGRNIYALSR